MAEYPQAGIDPREGLFEHAQFLGLRNNVGSESFELGDMETALNVDIDDALVVKRRKGYSAVVVAGVDRSLWSSGSVCLGVGSNALKLINTDFSTITLRTGLTVNRQLSYDSIQDRVFYANGVESGVVQNGQHRTWGITPPGVPLATATGGTLLAGDYQFAITYVRNDRQESGTPRAGAITLASAGGFSLTGISVSTDPTVTLKNVYVSTVGGTVLYLCGTIPNAQTTFTVAAVQQNAYPLQTQFLQPPPAGDFVAYWKGWMLVAQGNRLYPSEAFAPELFDLRKGLSFLDRITMIAPLNNVSDGVWLGTESQALWMDGESPEQWKFKVGANYGVIPGTFAFADGDAIGDGSGAGEQVALFATTRGLCLGKTGGSLQNLTETRFAYPSMDRGAGVLRRHRGIVQYVVTLEGTEVAGNMAA